LYLDEDLANDLAPSLRSLGHDVVHTREIGLTGSGDAKQFAHAIAEGRTLITANVRDFRLLHEALVSCALPLCPAGLRSHPGIVAMPNPNTRSAQRMAELLDQRLAADEPAALGNRFLRWRAAVGWEDLSQLR